MGSTEEKDGNAMDAPQQGSLSKAKAWQECMDEVLRDTWLAHGRPFLTKTELGDSLHAASNRYARVFDLLEQDARKWGFATERLPASTVIALLRAMPLTQDEQYALCEEASTLEDIREAVMRYLNVAHVISHRLCGSEALMQRPASAAPDRDEDELAQLVTHMKEVRGGQLELKLTERGKYLMFEDLLVRYVAAGMPFAREAFFRIFDAAGADPRALPESALCENGGYRAAMHVWLGRRGALCLSHGYPDAENVRHDIQGYYFRGVSTWDEAEALLRVHIGISNGDIYHRLESPQQHPFEVLVDGVVMRRMHEHYALRERFPDVDVVKELLDIR